MDKRISHMIMLAFAAIFVTVISLLPIIGAMTNAHK